MDPKTKPPRKRVKRPQLCLTVDERIKRKLTEDAAKYCGASISSIANNILAAHYYGD